MEDIFDSADTVWGEKTESFLILGPILAEAFAFIATTLSSVLEQSPILVGEEPESTRGCGRERERQRGLIQVI